MGVGGRGEPLPELLEQKNYLFLISIKFALRPKYKYILLINIIYSLIWLKYEKSHLCFKFFSGVKPPDPHIVL